MLNWFHLKALRAFVAFTFLSLPLFAHGDDEAARPADPNAVNRLHQFTQILLQTIVDDLHGRPPHSEAFTTVPVEQDIRGLHLAPPYTQILAQSLERLGSLGNESEIVPQGSELSPTDQRHMGEVMGRIPMAFELSGQWGKAFALGWLAFEAFEHGAFFIPPGWFCWLVPTLWAVLAEPAQIPFRYGSIKPEEHISAFDRLFNILQAPSELRLTKKALRAAAEVGESEFELSQKSAPSIADMNELARNLGKTDLWAESLAVFGTSIFKGSRVQTAHRDSLSPHLETSFGRNRHWALPLHSYTEDGSGQNEMHRQLAMLRAVQVTSRLGASLHLLQEVSKGQWKHRQLSYRKLLRFNLMVGQVKKQIRDLTRIAFVIARTENLKKPTQHSASVREIVAEIAQLQLILAGFLSTPESEWQQKRVSEFEPAMKRLKTRIKRLRKGQPLCSAASIVISAADLGG